ncbi:MAG: inorganic diphosphatase [Chloroflexota bacterium]|nr:inorganic diphosphatase [Dehalococcoidia bacterium]MDW8252818.1 inorganic diphosphatase [Chloroflexota bacterium]
MNPIEVVIEIPAGSRNKYEYDHRRGVFRLDRVLYSSVHYPADYGYIPETLEPDGDPLDALVIVHEPTFPGCHVAAIPIGCLDMIDDKGQDRKLIAVPVGDPRLSHIDSLEALGFHWQREIENFFQTYKSLEGKGSEIVGWRDAAFALRVLEEARARYLARLASG